MFSFKINLLIQLKSAQLILFSSFLDFGAYLCNLERMNKGNHEVILDGRIHHFDMVKNRMHFVHVFHKAMPKTQWDIYTWMSAHHRCNQPCRHHHFDILDQSLYDMDLDIHKSHQRIVLCNCKKKNKKKNYR